MLLLLALVACQGDPTPGPTAIPSSVPATQTPGPTDTPIPPTPTPISLAATVNGDPITLEAFEREKANLEAALAEFGGDLTEDEIRQRVMDALVEELLLAQGAAEAGFLVTEEAVQARLDALALEAGGSDALAAWQEAHGYTARSFREALARAIAAAWMRDQILSSVPETAEQVRVRQILLYNSEEAQQVLAQLRAGTDFGELARAYDPQGLGELGWVSRGGLVESELEPVVFSLEPGEISDVTETRLGYHILQVMEREAERPLDTQTRQILQAQALEDWLSARREASEVLIILSDFPEAEEE